MSSKTEFRANCSNLQAWVENGYDTRLLHRNLAFPLLKKLTNVGDLHAKKVFKDEIANKYFYDFLTLTIQFTITKLLCRNSQNFKLF